METVKDLLDLNVQVRQKKDVIVLITQNNCGKCEVLKAVIPQFDLEKPVLLFNLDGEDVDRKQAIKYFDIMGTPVLLGYKDGELVKKFDKDLNPNNLLELEEL